MPASSSPQLIGLSSRRGPDHFLKCYREIKSQGHHALLLPAVDREEQLALYLEQCRPHQLWLNDQRISYRETDCLTWSEEQLPTSATFFFTSGSQGRPKAIVHPDSHLHRAAHASSQALGIHKPTHLTPLPLWHMGGMLSYYRARAQQATFIPVKNDDLVGALNQHPNSFVVMVPTQLQRLLEQRIYINHQHLHYYLGGAAVSDDLTSMIHGQRLAVTISYGMTETAGAIATGARGTRATVMDDVTVACDEGGRLLVKSERLAPYQVVEGQLKHLPRDSRGFFATSDLARLEEGQRQLTILGRLDQVFVSGGENIDPQVIYRLLAPLQLGPVRAVAIPHPDLGHAFYLFVPGLNPHKEQLITEALPSGLKPFKILEMPQGSELKPTYQDFLKAAHA